MFRRPAADGRHVVGRRVVVGRRRRCRVDAVATTAVVGVGNGPGGRSSGRAVVIVGMIGGRRRRHRLYRLRPLGVLKGTVAGQLLARLLAQVGCDLLCRAHRRVQAL